MEQRERTLNSQAARYFLSLHSQDPAELIDSYSTIYPVKPGGHGIQLPAMYQYMAADSAYRSKSDNPSDIPEKLLLNDNKFKFKDETYTDEDVNPLIQGDYGTPIKTGDRIQYIPVKNKDVYLKELSKYMGA
jgi:hypothetical protein